MSVRWPTRQPAHRHQFFQRARIRLRKQVRPGLSERHVSAGRMQHDPAVRDCGGNRSGVLLGAAASIEKLRVDRADLQPTGVIGVDCVGDLKQLPLADLAALSESR